ncbi:hypothetical protein N826_15715 [Skermanella aerolata KACC 11604]|nr:hypothetical protein N826_15715 [Skermanella aerolata KACC 11604]
MELPDNSISIQQYQLSVSRQPSVIGSPAGFAMRTDE